MPNAEKSKFRKNAKFQRKKVARTKPDSKLRALALPDGLLDCLLHPLTHSTPQRRAKLSGRPKNHQNFAISVPNAEKSKFFKNAKFQRKKVARTKPDSKLRALALPDGLLDGLLHPLTHSTPTRRAKSLRQP